MTLVHVKSPLDHWIYALGSLEGVVLGFEAGNRYLLLQRAWCFQERLIATQVLLFADEEVVSECKTYYACE